MTYQDRALLKMNDTSRPILRDNPVTGEFVASYNNLAMIKLRIRTFNRMNTSHITFKLREKRSKVWIIINDYTVDRFTDGLLYPFGFPSIPTSKGKQYEFEINSQDSTPDNAIGVYTGFQTFATQYVYEKNILSHDPRVLHEFLIAKITSACKDPYTIAFTTLWFIPIFIYLYGQAGLLSLLYALFVYTYVPLSLHPNAILYMTVLGLGTTLYSRLQSKQIFIIAVLFLIQIPACLAFENILAANKAAMLVFFFILIGVIIALSEMKKNT
jgi:hypothetical protein